MRRVARALIASLVVCAAGVALGSEAPHSILIDTPMTAPPWARLERQVLTHSRPACLEFYRKDYDDKGRVQGGLRWGADGGPDDAFGNVAGWPELRAPRGADEVPAPC